MYYGNTISTTILAPLVVAATCQTLSRRWALLETGILRRTLYSDRATPTLDEVATLVGVSENRSVRREGYFVARSTGD